MACEDCAHKCLCIHSSLVLSSDGASFYKVMAGDFSSQLEIPAEFAARMNFRACKDAILKGPSGHLWHVNFFCTDISTSFRDGWQSFVSDNRIKAKDILVFRHANDIFFVVQVFGAIQRENQNNASLHNDTSCGRKEGILSGICSQKSCKQKKIATVDSSALEIIDVEPEKNEGIESKFLTAGKEEIYYDSSMEAAISSEETGKALHNTEKFVSPSHVLLKKHSSKSVVVPNVVSCSFSRDNSEALAVLHPVKTMEPIFSVTLTRSATSGAFFLTIPKDFGDCWLSNKKAEVRFMHHKNPGVWRHRLERYKGGRVYGVHWKRFVIENELHEGDNCVFKLINGVKHIFMLYVKR